MSVHAGPDMISLGLTLCLDAANTRSYPGTGSTWTDLSGNGHTGTIYNTPTFNSANNGYLDFDGIDDYVGGSNSSATDLTTDLTCEVFFKLDAVAGDWVRPFGKGDSTNRTYGLWYNTSTTGFLYQRYGSVGNFQVTYSTLPTVGQWYHMVGTTSGSSHVLYINGTSVGTATQAGPWFSSTEGYRIGAASFHTFHNGPISLVRLYNRGLSAAEVFQNYTSLRGRYGI